MYFDSSSFHFFLRLIRIVDYTMYFGHLNVVVTSLIHLPFLATTRCIFGKQSFDPFIFRTLILPNFYSLFLMGISFFNYILFLFDPKFFYALCALVNPKFGQSNLGTSISLNNDVFDYTVYFAKSECLSMFCTLAIKNFWPYSLLFFNRIFIYTMYFGHPQIFTTSCDYTKYFDYQMLFLAISVI